jgi:hypothetical protein
MFNQINICINKSTMRKILWKAWAVTKNHQNLIKSADLALFRPRTSKSLLKARTFQNDQNSGLRYGIFSFTTWPHHCLVTIPVTIMGRNSLKNKITTKNKWPTSSIRVFAQKLKFLKLNGDFGLVSCMYMNI